MNLSSHGIKEGFLILRLLKRQASNNLIGLDIGSDSFKILKINHNQNHNKVDNFLILPIPAGMIVKNEIKNTSALGLLLKDALRQTEIETKDVALSIPRASVIIKNINVDKRLNSEDIESRAWVEAHRHFPDLVGDIYLDFSMIGPSAQDSSQLELMLVICRKDQIKPYLEILRHAGLTPKIVDVNSFALERALAIIARSTPDLKTIALLNLDYNLSTLIVTHDNKLVYAHDQTFDGRRLLNQVKTYEEKLTQKTAVEPESLPNGLDPVPIQTIKESTDSKNKIEQETITDVEALKTDDSKYLDIFKENLTAHLRHTMHFFYSSRPNINIQKIILSGDCANAPQLASFIQREIGIQAEVANPFMNMELSSYLDKEKLYKTAPSLMLCYGLALSDVKNYVM